MNDKTALVIFSEIVQSLGGIREIAHELTRQSMSRGPPDRLSDEQIEAEAWGAEQVHKYEDSTLSESEDSEAATALLAWCREIEEKAVEMIKLCIEFVPPL
jgi:hypothetical protein